MAEHVELPRRRGLGAQHVALKADAVHEVADRRLGTGEVGVRLVVGAAHHLDAALGDQPAQVGAVLGVGVPVRLEVVDLGEHELVFRFPPGHFEVGAHQVEPVGLPAPARRLLGPQAGVGGLGVPPHRVVVEVADHVHRPARLGDDELEVGACRRTDTRAARRSPGTGSLTSTGTSITPSPGRPTAARAWTSRHPRRRSATRRRCGRPGPICSGASGGPTKSSVDSAEVTPNATYRHPT